MTQEKDTTEKMFNDDMIEELSKHITSAREDRINRENNTWATIQTITLSLKALPELSAAKKNCRIM